VKIGFDISHLTLWILKPASRMESSGERKQKYFYSECFSETMLVSRDNCSLGIDYKLELSSVFPSCSNENSCDGVYKGST